MFLGQRRRSLVPRILLAFVLVCFWPLRLPRFYIPFIILIYCQLAIHVYATSSIILSRGQSQQSAPSRLWLAPVLAVAFCAALLLIEVEVRASGFQLFTVPSSSMEPIIRAGDRIVADMRYYRSHVAKDGDVLIFKKGDLFAVKRVIGVGGEFVAGKNGSVYVNGRMLDEPYVQHEGNTYAPSWAQEFGPVPVPAHEYFVMGDNRDVSLDSRSPEYGFVLQDSVLGKALYTIYASRTGKRIE